MIRKVQVNDIRSCVKICDEIFSIEGYSYDIRSELESSFISNQFVVPEFYVYEDNGEILGFGGLSLSGFDNSVYGIHGCYVSLKHQSKGVGYSLVKYRIDRIKELGEIIFSTTKRKWHLERFGFKEIESPYSEWKLMQLNID